jgi:hypothetical protein
MPGHEGIDGNDMADQLAKLGSECPFKRPEPACGISMGVSKKAVMDWTIRGHRKHWDSLSGLKQVNACIQGPSAMKTRELLNLKRDQQQWVVRLLTGHLFKLGLVNSTRCKST